MGSMLISYDSIYPLGVSALSLRVCSKRNERTLLNDVGLHIEKSSNKNFKTYKQEISNAEKEKGERISGMISEVLQSTAKQRVYHKFYQALCMHNLSTVR